MKFDGYQQVVNPTVVNAPAVSAPRDPNAYGDGGKGWGDVAAATGQVNKVMVQKQDDEDAAAVVGARNEIMTRLTDGLYGEKGLLTTGVGENARGLTDRVTKMIQSASSDVIKNQNSRVAYALKGNLSENMANFQRIAASQERDQKENVDKSNYESALSNNSQLAALNYDKPEFVASQIKQNQNLLMARGISQGWSPETMEANRLNIMSSLVGNAALAAIGNKDYDKADNLLTQYRRDMNQETYGKLMEVVRKKLDSKTMDINIQNIVQQCLRPDGTIDLEKGYEQIDAINGVTAVKKKSAAGGNVDTAKQLAQQYGDLPYVWGGNGNGGLDCSGYTRKYLDQIGSPISSRTADGQAYQAQQQGLFYKDAAQAKPGDLVFWAVPSDRTPATDDINASGDNGDGAYQGITHIGIVQGDGTALQMGNHGLKPMDINTYAVVGYAHPGGNGGQDSETSVSAYDPDANQHMKEMFHAIASEKQQVFNQRKKDYMQSVSKAAQGAGSYAEALSIIKSSPDLDMDEINNLKSAAASYYGVKQTRTNADGSSGGRAKTYNPAKDQKILEVNNLKLQMGKELTAQEIANGNEASRNLIARGYADGSADLDNKQVMSKITDILDSGGSKDTIRQMLQNAGASDTQTEYYISLIDDTYDN